MVKTQLANAGDKSSVLGLGRPPGGGNGNPLQYSCLENPVDRGAWQATVHGVTRVGQDLATKQQQQKETSEEGSWPRQTSAVIKFPHCQIATVIATRLNGTQPSPSGSGERAEPVVRSRNSFLPFPLTPSLSSVAGRLT